jgi:hypothetical protein
VRPGKVRGPALVSYRIFLSHNTLDRAWCEWLRHAAEELGIEAYLAEHDVQPGRQLAAKVQRAIEASDAVVVLISDNSAKAPYVHQEVGWALHAKQIIIPLVQPGISSNVLAMLQGVEYIAFDFANPEEGRDRLIASLRRLIEEQQRRKQEKDAALLALACLALILLALSD